MSEVLRSAGYHKQRVLIETARVLDPQFDDGVLLITGAQLEMLRNLTAYLHRETTFVSEYGDVRYLTPTVSEWDSLQSIVADLEEELMGNENTVWGYRDRWAERQFTTDADEGDNTLVTTAIAEGHVYVLNFARCVNVTSACSLIRLALHSDSVLATLARESPVAINTEVNWDGSVVLKQGDKVEALFQGCGAGDDLYFDCWGYKMKVPVV